MTLRERWRAVPGDIRWGYAAVFLFGAQFIVSMLVGPDLFLFGSACLLSLLLAVLALVLTLGFIVYSFRWSRAVLMVLVVGCLTLPFAASHVTTDLHLILCIYRAGGPDSLNDWGQELIREQQGKPNSRVEPDQLPPGVRKHLAGWVSVNGVVRIERGGGFYHYGVVIYPRGSVQAQDWQRILGWPPEVVVYHEN